MTRALVGSIAVVLLLALPAGCGGGDDESSTQAWSDDFCSAAAEWRTSLDDVIAGLGPSDLSAEGVRDAVDEGVDATESFLDDVRGLGAPDTEARQEVESIVDSMADSVESTVDDLSAEFDDDSASLQDLLGKVAQAASDLGQLETELQSSLDDLENVESGELRDELQSNEDCEAARSGSGS